MVSARGGPAKSAGSSSTPKRAPTPDPYLCSLIHRFEATATMATSRRVGRAVCAVTSQTALPTLREVAMVAVASKRWIRLHKYGSGVGARFGVELLPADFAGPPRADTM